MGSLDGQVAIVTGSSSGIGEATARRLAAEGARIVVNSASSVAAGERIAAQLPGAIYVRADIADETQCKALIDAALQRLGRLDILINNAGVWPENPAGSGDLEAWDRAFAVNTRGAFLVTEISAPLEAA